MTNAVNAADVSTSFEVCGMLAVLQHPSVPPLTAAEQHVFALLLQGRSSAGIAAVRGTSLRTIANQTHSLFRKFGAHSRNELLAKVTHLLRTEKVFAWLAPDKSPALQGLARLKPRAQRAMRLRADGHSVKYISFELGIAMSTASVELKTAMRQLEIRSALELCALFGDNAVPAEAEETTDCPFEEPQRSAG